MPRLSPTASSLITLLNNVNELIVKSSDRTAAKDVMRALKVYADNKKFPLPESQIDDFYAILLDSKPSTLTGLIKNIAQYVISFDNTKH